MRQTLIGTYDKPHHFNALRWHVIRKISQEAGGTHQKDRVQEKVLPLARKSGFLASDKNT
jgi:hypothetical protein